MLAACDRGDAPPAGSKPGKGAPSDKGAPSGKQARPAGGIRVVSPKGTPLHIWNLDFVPQAINRAPDGSIYVGGSGKMAHLDTDGKVLQEVKLPSNVKPLPPEEEKKLREKLEKAQADFQKAVQVYQQPMQANYRLQQEIAKARVEAKKAEGDQDKKSAAERIEKLQAKNKKAAADCEAARKALMPAIQAMQELQAKLGPAGMRGTVTGIAATRRDVFVCRTADRGYGFEVWRTDRDFGHGEQIVGGLAGCCGQMDVQADGDELWIPENGRHQVHRYDRHGKLLATFGKNDRTAPDGFGGCCEPKNIRIVGDEIFTAESTQPVYIKRFSKAGRFLGMVAVPTYKTGCVRVCVDVSADKGQVFCLSPGENAIYVFEKDVATVAKSEDKRP